jgi:hypothetical protein
MGVPTVTPQDVTEWATRQAELLVESGAASDMHARAVLDLGGDPGELRWARTFDGLLSTAELADWARSYQSVAVLDVEEQIEDAREYYFIPQHVEPILSPGVIDVRSQAIRTGSSSRHGLQGVSRRTLLEEVGVALASAWECGPQEIPTDDVESFQLVRVTGGDDFEVRAIRWSRPTDQLPGL